MISCTDFHQIEWPYVCGYGMKSIREQETQYQLLVYGRCWEERQGDLQPLITIFRGFVLISKSFSNMIGIKNGRN